LAAIELSISTADAALGNIIAIIMMAHIRKISAALARGPGRCHQHHLAAAHLQLLDLNPGAE
jgi:hypothetical protein